MDRYQESNINSPTLSSVFMETVSYAARFSFRVNIENVEPVTVLS